MKKLFALVMAVAMIASMFGVCASAEAGSIKIGMSGPLTGGAAVYGICIVSLLDVGVRLCAV